MSAVTFFGEVRDVTSRAVDDSDEEDELVTFFDVDVVFKPDQLQLAGRQTLFVTVTDQLPAAGMTVVCNISTDSAGGLTGSLIQLDQDHLWLAVKFTSPLLSDSWQTVAIAGSIMRKLEPIVSETIVLLVDRSVNTLQYISTHAVPAGSEYGAKKAVVPQKVSSTFETAIFEWCLVHKTNGRILMIPNADSVSADLPVTLLRRLKGLHLPTLSDSNMFT